MTLMDNAYQRWKTEGRTYANRAERGAITRLAHQFFDLSDTAPSVRNNVGRETAVLMKEVLDRIELPPWEEIPDEAMIAAKPGGLNRWTIPHTEITLVRLKEGLHEGNWVFNSETDERAPEFYQQVKQMPYRPGASEGLYQLFVSEPGWMIPRSLIGALPGWMQLRPGGQAVWQWCALVLTLLVTAVLMVLIFASRGIGPGPVAGRLLPGDGVSRIRDHPPTDRDRLSFRSGIYYRETIRRAGFRPGLGFARRAGCIDSRDNESAGDGNHPFCPGSSRDS